MLGRNKKPAVDILEFEKVYDWYDAKKPHPRRTMVGQFLMSLLMRPHYEPNTETQEAIARHLDSGGQFIIAANHTKWHDPLVLASLQRQVPELRSTRKNMTGIVKTSLLRDADFSFTKKGVASLMYSMLRSGVEAMDSLPVFRPKDFRDKDGKVIDEERNKLLSRASKRFFQSVTTRLGRGNHIGIFPEGERNIDEPLKVKTFGAALGRIAVDGYESTGGNLMVLPISIEPGTSMRGRNVHIGNPISLEGLNKNDVNVTVHQALQDGLVAITS